MTIRFFRAGAPLSWTMVLAGLAGLSPAFVVGNVARAAEITPASRVIEAVVYRSQALVTREARVALTPGTHRVVLTEIPSVADADSFRVAGSGVPGTEIGGVEVRQDFRRPELTPEYHKLQQEFDGLTHQSALIDDRRKSIASLREFLAGLKATAGEESSKDLLTRGFAVDSWQRAFEFLSARFNGLAEEERGLDPRRREIAEKIEVARRQLEQLASQGGIQRWRATVLISATRAGDLDLRLSHLARGASWTPLYDARLDPATGKVRIVWQAQITQNTGEDWKDVAVTLSTTRPTGTVDVPQLVSVRLVPGGTAVAGRQQGGFVRIVDGLSLQILGKNDEDVLTVAPSVAGDVPATPSEIAVADPARRETAVVFDLPGKLDIPSDGQPHKHTIVSREMEGAVEHHAVPRLAPAVYLVAKVTLTGEVPLLSGRVQHFLGDDLVGSSSTPERVTGEEFTLSFGRDDRLKAERKLVTRRIDHRGKDDVIDSHFLTTLENHLPRDGRVALKDLIPVSGDERIVVTLDEETTTSGFTTDPREPGILSWQVPIPKDGRKEIHLRYSVRAPRGIPIAGLE